MMKSEYSEIRTFIKMNSFNSYNIQMMTVTHATTNRLFSDPTFTPQIEHVFFILSFFSSISDLNICIIYISKTVDYTCQL